MNENGEHGANGGRNGGGANADPANRDAEAPDATAAETAERLEALEAENAKLRDQALRALAEADNARKRAERDAANARDYAIERFASDLLGVADNLSRALESVPETERASAPDTMRNLMAGVELTERELLKTFERHGLRAIHPKGEPFDPNRHQAVAQFPSDIPAGRVAEVMQTGYLLGERVLRAAMVAVSTGPAGGAKPAGDQKHSAPGGHADVKI